MLDLFKCPFCNSQLTTTYLPIYEFRVCSKTSHKLIYQLRDHGSYDVVYLDYLDNINNTAIYINFLEKKIQYIQSRGTPSHSVINIPFFIKSNFSKNDILEMQSKIINLIPFI